MSVKSRLYLLAAVSIGTLVLLIGIAVSAMSQLAGNQDDVFQKSQAQRVAAEASWLGAQAYKIIADAIINRDLAQSRKDWADLLAEANGDLDQLAALADTEAERKDVAAGRESIKALDGYFQRLMPMLSTQNQIAEELRSLDGQIDRETETIRELLARVAESMANEAKAADAEFDATRESTVRTITIIAVLAGAALAAFSLWLIGTIIRPLAHAQEVAGRIADGDLTGTIRIEREDELGQTLRACDRMQESLREIARSLQDGANDIASTSSQLAASTNQIAKATEQQSQAASSMAASVEEMSVSISHMSDHAKEVKSAASQSDQAAISGGAVIETLVDDAQQAAGSVEAAAAEIRQLETLSERISSIVMVIRDVADQTNLLALNAAIEAARAGEAGRGFAVVADEVRKLAERTGKSTQDIAGVIEEVQRATRSVVTRMEQTVTEVRKGATTSQQAGEAITAIRQDASRVVVAVEEIGNALREQSTASTDIAKRVEQIAQMGEENSAAVEETAVVASSLENLAGRLQTVAGRFRV